MSDKAGTRPEEKLLGNKLPVTLSKGASGNMVNTMLRAMKHKKPYKHIALQVVGKLSGKPPKTSAAQ